MQIKHLSALCTLALWSFSVLLLPNVWPMVQSSVPIQSDSQYLHCTCKQATYPYNDGQDYQNTKIKLEFKLGWKQLGSNWGFNLRYVWACSEDSILQMKTEHSQMYQRPQDWNLSNHHLTNFPQIKTTLTENLMHIKCNWLWTNHLFVYRCALY